ncbi:hypothetical protein NL676_007003 [Syzygium grande]|nr:hypothetical protein NL676_007003 [Syzygium grande]
MAAGQRRWWLDNGDPTPEQNVGRRLVVDATATRLHSGAATAEQHGLRWKRRVRRSGYALYMRWKERERGGCGGGDRIGAAARRWLGKMHGGWVVRGAVVKRGEWLSRG